MFEEIAFGGLLLSPLVVLIPLTFLCSVITRLVLYKTGLYLRIWKPAWFEVSLFICYLATVVFIAGG